MLNHPQSNGTGGVPALVKNSSSSPSKRVAGPNQVLQLKLN